MATFIEDMWECECGHLEYGKNPPEECDKCWQINSFTKVPEDLREEKENNFVEEEIAYEYDEE